MPRTLQPVVRTLVSGLVAIIVALGSTAANAGLIATINKDTALEVDVSWTWNPEAEDSSSPVLTNWRVDLSLSRPGGVGLWTFILDALHLTNPHPAVDVVADIANYLIMFDNATDFGVLLDQTKTVRHRTGTHVDEYHVKFDRNKKAADTTIQLAGIHVPEPAILLLFATGAAAAAGMRLRPRRSGSQMKIT